MNHLTEVVLRWANLHWHKCMGLTSSGWNLTAPWDRRIFCARRLLLVSSHTMPFFNSRHSSSLISIPSAALINLVSSINPFRKAVVTSNLSKLHPLWTQMARIVLTDGIDVTGAKVSRKSIPGLWVKPRVTNLALYMSILKLMFLLILNTHFALEVRASLGFFTISRVFLHIMILSLPPSSK